MLLLWLGAVLGSWGVIPVVADGVLPRVQQQGAVRYMTGGVGVDEAKAVRAESSKYPRALTFALRQGNADVFTSQVQVEISKMGGASVSSATSDGPFMLIDLPAGK